MTGAPEPNVSRETSDKLQAYVDLLLEWTQKINLISKSSIPEVWDRHIADSMQIYALNKEARHWVDLGTGGGLPGVVVALLASETGSVERFTFVESDFRKATFLRTAVRKLSLNADVISRRIEDVPPLQADVVSARALADLNTLLGFADRHLASGGLAIFPKGAQWQKEAREAREFWSYRCEAVKSTTNPAAAVLKIQDIARV